MRRDNSASRAPRRRLPRSPGWDRAGTLAGKAWSDRCSGVVDYRSARWAEQAVGQIRGHLIDAHRDVEHDHIPLSGAVPELVPPE